MAETYDHLTPEQTLRHFRDYATIDGTFYEDLYLKVLNRAVDDGEISRGLFILGTYDPDDPRQESGITKEAMTRARSAISVKGSKLQVKDFAKGDDEYYDDKQDEIDKLSKMFNDTFDMDVQTNKDNRDMQSKILLGQNATADEIWKEFVEASNYLIKSPGSVENTMPLLKKYVNHYKDKDGNDHYLGLEEGDLNYILTSIHETHADTLRSYLDLTQADKKTMTEDQRNMIKELEKAGGVGALDKIRDMLGGGTNFNVYLHPSEDRKGITFRAYSLKEGSSMNPVSFELSAIIPELAVTWDDIRQRGMNRYKFEVVADMLEMESRGTKKFINEMIEQFHGMMKGVKTTNVKDYKSKRSGLNVEFFGTEEYPDTFLGWAQGLLDGNFFDTGPTGSDFSKLVYAGESQFGDRGIEFITEMNLLEYWFRSKPRWGKVEVDYFEELLGELPENISDEDLRKHLKIQYNTLKAEFDTWDKDFVSAMTKIPTAISATHETTVQILKRIGKQSVYNPKYWGEEADPLLKHPF